MERKLLRRAKKEKKSYTSGAKKPDGGVASGGAVKESHFPKKFRKKKKGMGLKNNHGLGQPGGSYKKLGPDGHRPNHRFPTRRSGAKIKGGVTEKKKTAGLKKKGRAQRAGKSGTKGGVQGLFSNSGRKHGEKGNQKNGGCRGKGRKKGHQVGNKTKDCAAFWPGEGVQKKKKDERKNWKRGRGKGLFTEKRGENVLLANKKSQKRGGVRVFAAAGGGGPRRQVH